MSTVAPGPTFNKADINDITLSPNYATGIVIGLFLLGVLTFAIRSMLSVEVSDKMQLPDSAYKLPERKHD
jgi:hypothetical protein